ncbi:hypothetical protein [Enterococcus sp. SMC-9]|uniref:hypothetical protein n=1 Tax=Enterococcus sp. SMC-9 TaxID=2862343 RepID=UPI001E576E41|nr:hypothetical protein [Enterococcus sp. SMC-9]MCD1023459.1 hypothetical protein [Enterococcus sp. SMC-9]
MGLSPREEQKLPNYGWDFLDRHLKLHLQFPGSTIQVIPEQYAMNKSDMLFEMEKNGYHVDTSDPKKWIVS